jgi:hypothetical protein
MSSGISSSDTPQSWEGQRVQPANDEELREIINRAFDYRGDVTLQLKGGGQVVGFVFDRCEDGPRPHVKLYLPNCDKPQAVSYEEVAGVVFSGEDTAFGRSWEDRAQ